MSNISDPNFPIGSIVWHESAGHGVIVGYDDDGPVRYYQVSLIKTPRVEEVMADSLGRLFPGIKVDLGSRVLNCHPKRLELAELPE